MTQPRVIMKVIRTCQECPHGGYMSGGAGYCQAADRDYLNSDGRTGVQPWCPLDKAPSSIT
jgi:hypothetical protein